MSESGMEIPISEKECPFCKERVRADAKKCRYCGSLLSGSAPTEQYGSEKVVYVVDRDLIRFAKFAAATLGLFTVVGLYLFGIDVKKTQTALEDAKDRIEKLQGHLDASLAEFDKKRSEIQRAAAEVGDHSKLARDALDRILETQQKASRVYTALVRMQDGSISIQTATVVTEARPPQGGVRQADLWPVGARIRVRFLGGTVDDQEKVRQWSREWTNGANIHFDYVDDSDAEVRVSFKPDGGSWSFVGTQALDITEDKPTMNLAWVQRSNVLHEFGHVLGLLHENTNPNNDIPWDEEQVYATLSGPPNFWSREAIYHNVFKTYPPDHFPADKPFDPLSIMAFSFPEAYFTESYELGGASEISQLDWQFVGALYP